MLASRGWWRTARHLEFLNRLIVQAAFEPLRLLIAVPPQHGKSSLFSQFGPAWFLGSFPDLSVILASYEADFAAEWGRKARDVLEEFGPAVFGIWVRPDSSAANRWQVVGHQGAMRTAGLGGPITGKPADLLLIDDPVKNQAEATSETVQSDHWEWWLSVARTRLHKNSSVLVMMTRWDKRDIGGQLVEKAGFQEVRLPALAEHKDPLGRALGEALWPEMFSRNYLISLRDTPGGAYWFAAQYQGTPTLRTGGMFERAKVEIVEAVPAGCRSVRWWDLAAGKKAEKADPDWTVGLKLSRSDLGVFFVEDVRRGRWRAKELEERMRNTAVEDGRKIPIWIEEEPGSAGSLYIDGTLVPLLAGFNAHGQRATGDKTLRAEAPSAQWDAGNMKIVRAHWNEAFLSECESFPHGTHDDQVDGLSGAFSKLAPIVRKGSTNLASLMGG